MIAEPSTPQIVESIREELRTKVVPQVNDPATVVALQMIDELLANVATRANHEIGWMIEEIAAIDELATTYLSESNSASSNSDALRNALSALHDHTLSSHHLSDVNERYRLASEVLSCGLEASIARDDTQWRERWRSALNDRLGHEIAIMGSWGFVGRG
jgi:hypothetical protein